MKTDPDPKANAQPKRRKDPAPGSNDCQIFSPRQKHHCTAAIPTQRSAKFLMRMFVTFLLLMEPASRKPNPAFIIMYQTTKNMQHISIHFLCPFRRSLQNIYTCHVFSYQYMNGLNRYLIQNGTCIKITRDPFTRRNSWFKLTFSVSTSVKIGLYKNKEYGKSY